MFVRACVCARACACDKRVPDSPSVFPNPMHRCTATRASAQMYGPEQMLNTASRSEENAREGAGEINEVVHREHSVLCPPLQSYQTLQTCAEHKPAAERNVSAA